MQRFGQFIIKSIHHDPSIMNVFKYSAFFLFLFVSKPANTSVGKIVYCISLFCCMLLHFQHSRCSIMSNYFNTVAVYIDMCNNLFINIIRYGKRRGATEVWRIIYPHFYCIKILIPFCRCCF